MNTATAISCNTADIALLPTNECTSVVTMRNISIVMPHNAAGITTLGRTINIAGVITVFHCAATFIFPNNATNIITTDIASIVTVSYLGRNRVGSFGVIISYNATGQVGVAAIGADCAGIAAIFNDAAKVMPHNATDRRALDFANIVAVGDRAAVLSGNATDIASAIDTAIDEEILHAALSILFIQYCTNKAKKAFVTTCSVDIETADRVVLSVKVANICTTQAIANRRPGALLFAAEVDVVHQLRVGRWLCSFVVCAIDEITKGCEIFCIVDQIRAALIHLQRSALVIRRLLKGSTPPPANAGMPGRLPASSATARSTLRAFLSRFCINIIPP